MGAVMAYLAADNIFKQYLNTASNGNIYISYSAIEGRTHMRCSKCSAVNFFTPSIDGSLDYELQKWIKGHRHDLAQASEEEDLRKELQRMANNAAAGRQSIEDLKFTKQKMQDKLGITVPSAPLVPEIKRRKIR